MGLFSAKDAKSISDSAKESGYNYQIRHVLDSIKDRASIGKNYLVLDDKRIVLWDYDYELLEKLGYTVERHILQPDYYKFGVIRW